VAVFQVFKFLFQEYYASELFIPFHTPGTCPDNPVSTGALIFTALTDFCSGCVTTTFFLPPHTAKNI